MTNRTAWMRTAALNRLTTARRTVACRLPERLMQTGHSGAAFESGSQIETRAAAGLHARPASLGCGSASTDRFASDLSNRIESLCLVDCLGGRRSECLDQRLGCLGLPGARRYSGGIDRGLLQV